MKKLISILLAMLWAISAYAAAYNYKFQSTKLSDALVRVAEDHPELYLNFIYNELGNYYTSAAISTDDTYEALRQIIGRNPVGLVQKGSRYFIEALQHGKYLYKGQAVTGTGEPVEAATVMVLSPKDSTVLSYGITDARGRFNIPCDRKGVILKLSSVGYKTVFHKSGSPDAGKIVMEALYVDLEKVEVEARYADLYSDKVVYRPSAQQKRASQTAIDLLRFLAIPQITIDPNGGSVSDNFGNGVQIFINSARASSEEIAGLPTMDVRRVEYLEFPADPRFKGAERVINFIVQEYEYGGYTKFLAREDALTGFASSGSVFSKFTYKKMSYDVYAGVVNSNSRHGGNSSTTRFLLTDSEGEERYVIRNKEWKSSKAVTNSFPVTFRATYNTDKMQIRNTIGYTHTTSPVRRSQGIVTYPGDERGESEYRSSNPSIVNSASYSGSFYFVLPKDFSLDVTPTLNYSHTNDSYSYEVTGMDAIARHARENAYNYRVDINARKSFNHIHSLSLSLNHGGYLNRLKYLGNDNPADRFYMPFAIGKIMYGLHRQKLYLNADAGIVWEGSYINGIKTDYTYPSAHLNIQYSFSNKNMLSAYFQYAASSPTLTFKSPDILQNNEYLYITGNPYLKNSNHITLHLSHTWIPSNKFSLSAYGQYFGDYRRMLTVYNPYDGGQAVIRSYVNNGKFQRGRLGVNASLRLLDRKLQFMVSPVQYFYRSTGLYRKRYNPFEVSAEADFFAGNFYFQVYGTSPSKGLYGMELQLYSSRIYYYIKGGWGNSHLNISLTAYNVFNRGWCAGSQLIESHYFTQDTRLFSSAYHPRLNLSLTYTFNYGKKVQRGNEIGEQGGASSAILK